MKGNCVTFKRQRICTALRIIDGRYKCVRLNVLKRVKEKLLLLLLPPPPPPRVSYIYFRISFFFSLLKNKLNSVLVKQYRNYIEIRCVYCFIHSDWLKCHFMKWKERDMAIYYMIQYNKYKFKGIWIWRVETFIISHFFFFYFASKAHINTILVWNWKKKKKFPSYLNTFFSFFLLCSRRS